jgi:O-methyltransferase involved in polyketide biosynthesis
MNLSDVSRTAILTLICRALGSQRPEPLISDPMAVICLENLLSGVSSHEREWILGRKALYEGRGAREVEANARRQHIFDQAASRFIVERPGSTVLNLGCGFDTRFWRIDNTRCSYTEIDLPELIDLKKRLLGDRLTYPLIGCSVLDPLWIDRVTQKHNADFLLLAEGLFMYLPAPQVEALLQTIAERFTHSRLVMDTIPRRYTSRLLKWLVDLRVKAAWDLQVSFLYGIRDARELESYGFRDIQVQPGSVGPIYTLAIS